MANQSKLPGTKLATLDDALEIWRAPLTALREQDKNARVMPREMLEHLARTIREEGHLESLPYTVMRDGHFDIISGHHRVRAARMAGLDELIVIADTRNLSKSKVRAKQIAHNAIEGTDDVQTLREMYLEIEEIDARLEAFVTEADLDIAIDNADFELQDVRIPFEWHYVTLCFLPNQKQDWETVLGVIGSDAETIGCLDVDVFDQFAAVARSVGKTEDIRNVGAIVMRMVEIVQDWFHEQQEDSGPA